MLFFHDTYIHIVDNLPVPMSNIDTARIGSSRELSSNQVIKCPDPAYQDFSSNQIMKCPDPAYQDLSSLSERATVLSV